MYSDDHDVLGNSLIFVVITVFPDGNYLRQWHGECGMS